jgi:uncharacterized membrane protein
MGSAWLLAEFVAAAEPHSGRHEGDKVATGPRRRSAPPRAQLPLGTRLAARGPTPAGMRMPSAKESAAIAAAAAALGLIFAGYSTYDYAQQLDRQVHAVHCSFIPGAPVSTEADNACKTALFSPYSALFRATWWGGVPISLFAFGAFTFFVGFGLYLALGSRAYAFHAAAGLAPFGASVVMFFLSAVQLRVFCKLCVGIYLSSMVLAGAAAFGWRASRREALEQAPSLPVAAPPAPGRAQSWAGSSSGWPRSARLPSRRRSLTWMACRTIVRGV